ncbi:MAG: folate-binding protein YgfZ [Planctomycetes bacterium]|nr:folate-binding protein YgfZ [Planctomycetota bacterium]
MSDSLADYNALTRSVGVADLSDRTQVELTGADRAKFLHNLCTNEVRKLPLGAGCEAFLLNVQGHILAHVYIFAGQDSHVLDSVPGEGAKVVAHLDRYLIREDVQLADRSGARGELLLSGPDSPALLAQMGITSPPEARLAHIDTTLAGTRVSIRRVDLTSPVAYFIACESTAAPSLLQTLQSTGARMCGPEAVEMARIEAGQPYYGRDIHDRSLPQEVARDAQAISFIKGCYIGQETVARIDALGHVNKTLVGVKFAGDQVPTAGTELTRDGQPAGQVTSATYSPRLLAPLALAYVRRGSNTPGTKLESPVGPGEVVRLPLE